MLRGKASQAKMKGPVLLYYPRWHTVFRVSNPCPFHAFNFHSEHSCLFIVYLLFIIIVYLLFIYCYVLFIYCLFIGYLLVIYCLFRMLQSTVIFQVIANRSPAIFWPCFSQSCRTSSAQGFVGSLHMDESGETVIN